VARQLRVLARLAETAGMRDRVGQRPAEALVETPEEGVSNVPGAIVQTRTSREARSRAAQMVRPAMPALEAA